MIIRFKTLDVMTSIEGRDATLVEGRQLMAACI